MHGRWIFRPQTSHRRGIWAEYIALMYLLCRGYWPCAMRYKTRVGEVDLVMRRGRVLVFVEVKYRENKMDAAYAISPQSISRIRRAAEQYRVEKSRESHKLDTIIRFDAIILSKPLVIKHIKNAF